MNSTNRRLVSLAVASALLTGGFVSVAASAQATPDQIIGELSITTEGSATPNGTRAQNPVIDSQSTTLACPVGFREKGITVIAQNDKVIGGFSQTWDSAVPDTYGNGGINGKPVELSQIESYGYNSNRAFDAIPNAKTTFVAGDFEMRRYCFSEEYQQHYDTDKYFVSQQLTMDAAGNWAAKAAPAGTASVVLTSSTSPSTGQVTLSGTVQKADGTVALDAAGTIEFSNAAGGTKVGEGNVAAGIASWTSGKLDAATYSYTAKFVSSDPSKYLSSAVTAAQDVVLTPVVEGSPTDVNVTVAIPAPVIDNGLKLTVANTAVALGTATQVGGNFTASGALGAVTVADGRLTKAAWNLTGKVSEFTNTLEATKTIQAGALGWAPSVATNQSGATAGPTVAPGTTGLGTPSVLAQAPASTTAGTLTTVTNATLNFSVPSTGSVAPGTYGAKLTLTLI